MQFYKKYDLLQKVENFILKNWPNITFYGKVVIKPNLQFHQKKEKKAFWRHKVMVLNDKVSVVWMSIFYK